MKIKSKCTKPHILIVDDNEFNIYTLQKLLELMGYIVPDDDVTVNGKLAIDKILDKKCNFCG